MKRRTFVVGVVASNLLAISRRSVAESAKAFRLGFLSVGAPPEPAEDFQFAAFAEGLRALGYAEGRDVVFERRFADDRPERLPELAGELVRLPVEFIITQGAGTVRAAASATKSIPIVMIAGSNDPVADGFAKSLGHPGGNITGLAYAVSPERFGKELELLKAAVPEISRIAVAWDLNDLDLYKQTIQPHLESAARKIGIEIQPPVQTSDPDGFETAFTTIKQRRANGLMFLIAGSSFRHRERLAAMALANRLPSVAAFRFMPEAGGLMSYGPDLPDMYRRAAIYVDKIRKGAKPGDLPIELPRKDDFVINLRTAKALGLTIPQSLVLRADEVIQ